MKETLPHGDNREYSREAYEAAQQRYEAIKSEIGGEKSDEEILALMAARSGLCDELTELYDRAWNEAQGEDAKRDGIKEDAEAFLRLSRPEQLKELLRRELSRGVRHIPEGRFTSELPGVDQLTVLHHRKSPGDTPARSFAVYVSHTDPKTGKRTGETFTVTDEGRVLGAIPRGWNFAKEALTEELVRFVDDVGGAFFVDTHDSILPPGEWGNAERGPGGVGRGPKEEVVDRRRLRFFKNQPGALFGFRGATSTTWEGYHGFAFSDRIILDAPKVGNAVYILPLDGEFPIHPEQLALPPGFRLDEKGREQYLGRYWSPYAGLTKKESLESGATRVIHPDYATVDDEWERKMGEKLAG